MQFLYGKQRERKNLFLRLKLFMRKDDEKIARARHMCSSFFFFIIHFRCCRGRASVSRIISHREFAQTPFREKPAVRGKCVSGDPANRIILFCRIQTCNRASGFGTKRTGAVWLCFRVTPVCGSILWAAPSLFFLRKLTRK